MWQKFKELFVVKSEQLEIDEVIASAEHAPQEEAEQTGNEVAAGVDLNRNIRQVLAPALRADGFTGSGRNFRKINADWVVIVSVESSRAGTGFALNIGLHPLAFHDVLGKPVDAKKIKMQLCEFRTRLPSQNKASWWHFESDEASVRQVIETIRNAYVQHCSKQLKELSGQRSPLCHARADQFAKGDYDFSPFQNADTRIALVIARLHQQQGRHIEAMAFAHYGLKHVGNSVGLRRDFEALLMQAD